MSTIVSSLLKYVMVSGVLTGEKGPTVSDLLRIKKKVCIKVLNTRVIYFSNYFMQRHYADK